MRHPRLKPQGMNTFMHVYNRIAGSSDERPFGDAEKAEFIRRLKQLDKLYAIDVIAVQVMSNHYHAIVHIPADPPSLEETAKRYKRRYPNKHPLDPDTKACAELAQKLRDISEFMRELQQPFTCWFNRTRTVRRRGHLWAGRFKNTVLEEGLAVWDCWKYIEMNPVRARMVENPAEYRFCSYGEWAATGRHPFAKAIDKHLMPRFTGLLQIADTQELKVELRKEFARMATKGMPTEAIENAIAAAAEKEPFTTCVDRRVRYWVDGLVIGSELFVRNTIAMSRGSLAVRRRKFTKAVAHEGQDPPFYCFKQLRVLLE